MELAADGRVDDAAYAAWHGAQRTSSRPRSRIHLRSELQKRGIDSQLALSECAKVDEAAAALSIARRKTSLSNDALLKYLLRQGFPLSATREAVKWRHDGNRADDIDE